ncbi:MAG: dicarboxylate/amino acid:cation symporter [Rhodospirillaceae bacterium]
MLKAWFEVKLWKRILSALVLGVIVGLIWGDGAESIRWIGDVFVRLIRMLVVPLIFTTLVAGVVSMGEPKRLGSIGVRAFSLYLLTTAAAIVIGLVMGIILQPGAGVDLSGATARDLGPAMSVAERLYAVIPTNPIAALAEGNILAIILFAILVGLGIVLSGAKAKVLGETFNAAADVMLKITFLVMELAPFGVFALIAWVSGTQGVATLANIFVLAVAVYIGCFVHMVLVYGGVVKFICRLPLMPFIRGAVDPQLVAYSTSSSAATLPATMAASEENHGVGTPVSSSVIPLGATVNMDGTALYVGIVALFTAQAFGISLTMSDYLIIGLTTTLVSIGTASVPSASLFLLAAVLESIGVSGAQTAIIVGFILPFDRVLDMMRTVVNVTGDLTVSLTVAKFEHELDEGKYRARPKI